MRKVCVFLSVLLVCSLGPVFKSRAETPDRTGEVVVTATRVETDIRHLPDSVTVITGEEIDRREVQGLYQALESYPSITIKHNGWLGQWGYLRLRGGKNQDTVVLFDGVRLYDPSYTANDFGDLWSWFDAENLKRIEIVRGPQSALYGSNAMSGAVNLIPRKGGGPLEVRMKAGYGRYETWRGSGYIKGSAGPVGYFLGLSGVNTDGLYRDDEFRQSTVDLNLNTQPFETRGGFPGTLRLDYTMRYSYGYLNYQQWDWTSFRAYNDPHAERREQIQIHHLTLSGKPFPWWKSRLTVGYHLTRRDYLDRDDGILGYRPDGSPVTDSYFDGFYRGRVYPVVFQNDFYLREWGILTAGVEYYREKADFYSATAWGTKDYDDEVSTTSYFANLFLNLFEDRLAVDLGARIDDHEEFGTHFTYKLGVAYFLTDTLKLRATLATGFRAPSLFNLYDPRYGNPDLDPERSTGGDVGLEQELWNGKLRWSVTWFNTHYKERISFNYSTWRYYNSGGGVATGLETEVEVRPYRWLSLSINYTYTEGQEDDFENLALVPHHQVGARATVQWQRWNLNLYYKYVGRRTAYDHRHIIPDYSRVDLTGSYALNGNTRIFLRAENLFDVDYEWAAGYRAPGLALFGGIKVRIF
ncbi:TonB-dependent siderophore receptor [Thermosulfurimonas sp. F29]|uniref:TonB-dependent receptor plug domain-containing protein n=1 Tax=Thermosulfurimonas sp. F29 TaxID=2867247 RepID=UPI001C831F84|nr:TonB-dependent receptor [Thermosulfurimonas sp. F29]MBX6422952.1 TonB-dependent receptor [Thermosulfurimonas sp. F29]